MSDHEALFFDSSQANNIATDYYSDKNKARQYAIVSQLFDFVYASHLKKNTPYVFTTTLSKAQFLKVLDELGLEPKYCDVERVSVFSKMITVRF